MTLERALGMDEGVLADEGHRRLTEGSRLLDGGEGGFGVVLTGYRRPDGSYARRGSSSAWHRDVRADARTVYRSSVPKGYALSVRCV